MYINILLCVLSIPVCLIEKPFAPFNVMILSSSKLFNITPTKTILYFNRCLYGLFVCVFVCVKNRSKWKPCTIYHLCIH